MSPLTGAKKLPWSWLAELPQRNAPTPALWWRHRRFLGKTSSHRTWLSIAAQSACRECPLVWSWMSEIRKDIASFLFWKMILLCNPQLCWLGSVSASCWCFQRSWDVEALTQVAVQGSREDRFVREDNWALKAKEMYNKLSIIFLIHIIQGNYTCKVHVHVHVQDCVALPFRWTPSLE